MPNSSVSRVSCLRNWPSCICLQDNRRRGGAGEKKSRRKGGEGEEKREEEGEEGRRRRGGEVEEEKERKGGGEVEEGKERKWGEEEVGIREIKMREVGDSWDEGKGWGLQGERNNVRGRKK
jgi:hypothetical protein